MKIKTSYLLAIGLFAAIILWFIFADPQTNNGQKTKPIANGQISDQTGNQATQNNNEQLPKVVISNIAAEPHKSYLLLHGQSEPDREVRVKAETAGLVVDTPVKEGRFVEKNTLLCRQDIDARGAALDQAKAVLKTRELEYEAAKALVKKGYRSETATQSAKAALDGARAAVKQAEIELANIEMRAPFAGIFERRLAEKGEYLSPGQPCGLLLDINPLIIVGEITEKQIKYIKRGQSGQIRLSTGETVRGKIRRIDNKANPRTRTFKIELAVGNSDYRLKSGVSAQIKLAIGQTMAHFIPARILTLNDAGETGVKILSDENIVRFVKIKTIDEQSNGIWVSGLPEKTRLIIRGQDYVSEGIEARIINTDNNDKTQSPQSENNNGG